MADGKRRVAAKAASFAIRFSLFAIILWWLFADTYARHFPTSRDENTIRFAHFGSADDYAFWREVVAEFERTHPGTHVRQEYVVGLSGFYNTKMRQQILSGTLPEVALIQLGPFHELAENFADLDDFVTPGAGSRGTGACGTGFPAGRRAAQVVGLGGRTLPPRASPPSLKRWATRSVDELNAVGLQAFRWHGRQRGLPVSGGNLLIYCNAECFKRAAHFHGRPVPLPLDDWTIDDFRATAELLTCDFDGDGTLDQFGLWHPRWIYYLPLLWSFGADITDATYTRWTLTGPKARDALTFYRDLIAGDNRVCPRYGEMPQIWQDVGFLTGKVGMCVNGPWFQPFLAKTKLADSYVVAHVPRGPGGRVTRVTFDGVVIRGDLAGQRLELAREFVAFVLSEPVQDEFARRGRALPARVASQASFVDPPGDPRRLRFVEALAYSRTQPILPGFGAVDRAINRQFGRLLDVRHPASVDEVLQSLIDDPVIQRNFVIEGEDAR